MDFIDLRPHLLLPMVLSIIISVLILIFRRTLFIQNKILWRGILLFFISYGTIVGWALCEDLFLSYEISQFKNADGGIDYEMLSVQQKNYWDSYISDTGRNFSMFTGLIFSGLITIFYFLVSILKKYLDRNANY